MASPGPAIARQGVRQGTVVKPQGLASRTWPALAARAGCPQAAPRTLRPATRPRPAQRLPQAATAVGAAGTPPRPHVTVLGGGVNGWATALAVASLPSAPATTLVAASLDDTTSHGAGGLWEPYKCGATPAGLIARWGGATLDHLRRLARSPDAGPAGVAEHAVFQLWSAAGPAPQPPDPAWASLVAPTFRRLDRSELGAWEAAAAHTPGGTVQYSSGWTFTSVTAQPGRYLPWLAARARAAGVEAVVASVASLADLAALSPARPAALVNCAGLGARALCGDASLGPVRGQVARLAAPWVKAAVFVDEDTYVIPNTDFTVVGGTAQVGDYDTAPRAGDRADILARAARAVPGLVGAPSLGDWAGLRPVRTTVRVELEEAGGGGGVPGIPVVHNYGHGGSGVTLHWGCAADAAALVEGVLRQGGGV